VQRANWGFGSTGVIGLGKPCRFISNLYDFFYIKYPRTPSLIQTGKIKPMASRDAVGGLKSFVRI